MHALGHCLPFPLSDTWCQRIFHQPCGKDEPTIQNGLSNRVLPSTVAREDNPRALRIQAITASGVEMLPPAPHPE